MQIVNNSKVQRKQIICSNKKQQHFLNRTTEITREQNSFALIVSICLVAILFSNMGYCRNWGHNQKIQYPSKYILNLSAGHFNCLLYSGSIVIIFNKNLHVHGNTSILQQTVRGKKKFKINWVKSLCSWIFNVFI